MSKHQVFYANGILYLSYAYLKSCGISKKRIEKWVNTRKVVPSRIQGMACLNYDDLTPHAQSKLKSKTDLIAFTAAKDFDAKTQDHAQRLKYCLEKGFIRHLQHYKDAYQILHEKAVLAAQRHAAWEYILEVKSESRDLECLFTAFNQAFPGKYSCKHSFANAIKKATANGIESMAIDKRLFSAPKNVKRISAVNQYWTASLVSLGNKLSNRQVWEKLEMMCKGEKMEAPSKSWVDKYRKALLKNPVLFQARYGAAEAAKKMPYVSTVHALHANDQWQMDGWDLPFYTFYYDKDGKIQRFKKQILVVVRDSYSKKIVGYAVGRSENTLLIMEALKRAVATTGFIPSEIVTDNHAFNQTKEAVNLKQAFARLGSSWTVTSNPQHKALVERYNQHLDWLCREYPGYTGQGVRSKNIDARPKPEMLDRIDKTHLSEDEAKAIALQIITEFNSKALKGEISPNEAYDQSQKPHGIAVDVFERARLLTAQTEVKVSRGQITIKRGQEKFEYQLPAALYLKYNDEKVVIHYEDLSEAVYLFDRNTGEPIIELSQKAKVHGATVNQVEKDKELLNKHKGRVKGVLNAGKKAAEEIRDQALAENPEAAFILSEKVVPKNVKKELERQARMRQAAAEDGINLDKISIPEREDDLNPVFNQPKKLDTLKAFKISSNHQIAPLSLSDLED